MSGVEAARVTDELGHTEASLGFWLGAIAGAVVGGVLVAATGGAALLVIGAVAAGAGTGALGGMYVGEAVESDPTGPIATGSPTLIIGTDRQRAGRAGVDFVACRRHPRKLIAQGSETVAFGGGPGAPFGPAARKTDKTQCDGVIREGWATVIIGGPTVTVVEIEPEVPEWLQNAAKWTALIGMGILTGGSIYYVGIGATIAGMAGGYVLGEIGTRVGGWLGGLTGNEALRRLGEVGGGQIGGMLFGGRLTRFGQRMEGRALSPILARNTRFTRLAARTPGQSPTQIQARMTVARDFYHRKMPFNSATQTQAQYDAHINSHIAGTDLRYPVRTRFLKEDTTLYMAQAPGATKPGSYVAAQPTPLRKLGIGENAYDPATGSYPTKHVYEVRAKAGTEVLESTSAPRRDFWSAADKSNNYQPTVDQTAEGGGRQIVQPDSNGWVVDPATGKPMMQDLGTAPANLMGKTPQQTAPSAGPANYGGATPVTGDTPYVPPSPNVGRPGTVGDDIPSPFDDGSPTPFDGDDDDG
jgi:uncharacterized Zn-binding protein involved in type VI secretion